MRNFRKDLASCVEEFRGAIVLVCVATFYVGIALVGIGIFVGALLYAALRLKIEMTVEALVRVVGRVKRLA